MEKYITDERAGLKYDLVGDYYLIAGDDEPEQEPKGFSLNSKQGFSFFMINDFSVRYQK